MSILKDFFTQTPYLLNRIFKPQAVINEVSPNLFNNLYDSSKEFIKGVVYKDTEYIEQITATALKKRLRQDFEAQKDQDFLVKYDMQRYNFDVGANSFVIAPYVIFGQDFHERTSRQNLFESMRLISSNLFIKDNPELGAIEKLKKIFNGPQIFGFHCLYQPVRVGGIQEQGSHSFLVSFQTESNNIDPYIVDMQGVLVFEWLKKKPKTQ